MELFQSTSVHCGVWYYSILLEQVVSITALLVSFDCIFWLYQFKVLFQVA
jgi:hypothetical protein